MEMIWEEPPARRDARSRSGRVDAMLVELKKHPGQWAVVSEFRGGGNTSIWKKRGCEATTRRDAATGLTKTYARWPETAKATVLAVETVAVEPVPAPKRNTTTPAARQEPAEDEGPAPTLGSIRRATLVAQHTKGTCRTCGARNRGLTNGVCRMCTIRAQEKAALAQDGADQ